MAGRPSSNNGSSASSNRKGKSHDEDVKEKGPTYQRQADDDSDGDELGDSESERGEIDQRKRKNPSTTTSTGAKSAATSNGRGRGRPSAASTSARAIAAASTSTATSNRSSSLVENKGSPYTTIASSTDKTPRRPASPPSSTERASALEGSKSSKSALPAQGSPRETTKTTAGSTSAPYYYNQPSAASTKRPSQSPREAQFSNQMPFTNMTSTGGYKAEPGSSTSNSTEDLTLHEVDKFLDLIEKHNLHTSNEDDMARSVTELYQEWLEWCAKRSVQSTKSKQALVAEFVRIHQGEYGRLRQQRAEEIVKGRAGGLQDGSMNPLTIDLAGQPISYLPSSKSTPSFASKYKEDEVDGHLSKSVSASTRGKGIPSGSTSSHYIHVPSPSIAPRALTPGPSSAYQSQGQSETLYRRIRDDVWKDASNMIERAVHEQMTVLIDNNTALRSRVEQLEIHSDNLAQWIQHLNRVQDELTQSIQSAPLPLREEVVVMEDPNVKYNRHPTSHDQRSYAPSYHHGPTSIQSSPKRSYAIRKSPSPPIISHQSTAPRRTIGSPHRDQPRDTRDYHSTNNSARSDPYDRSYYTYPVDDREQPPPLPSRSPHQAKRARNGY